MWHTRHAPMGLIRLLRYSATPRGDTSTVQAAVRLPAAMLETGFTSAPPLRQASSVEHSTYPRSAIGRRSLRRRLQRGQHWPISITPEFAELAKHTAAETAHTQHVRASCHSLRHPRSTRILQSIQPAQNRSCTVNLAPVLTHMSGKHEC